MDKIIVFKTKDNRHVFKTKEECVYYEEMYDKIKLLEDNLPPKPTNDWADFINGKGYLQHDLKTIDFVFHEGMKVALDYKENLYIRYTIDKGYGNVDLTKIIEVLGDDCMLDPLGDLIYRINCIDYLLREWGQPYFKNHPQEATIKRLN